MHNISRWFRVLQCSPKVVRNILELRHTSAMSELPAQTTSGNDAGATIKRKTQDLDIGFEEGIGPPCAKELRVTAFPGDVPDKAAHSSIDEEFMDPEIIVVAGKSTKLKEPVTEEQPLEAEKQPLKTSDIPGVACVVDEVPAASDNVGIECYLSTGPPISGQIKV
ncbi:unnamed protein product, partial [Cyprideis torosa]